MPFQKIETYLAVKTYIEQNLNPALAKNVDAFSSAFADNNLAKLNQIATEQMILTKTGWDLLDYCANKVFSIFPPKIMVLINFKVLEIEKWKKVNIYFSEETYNKIKPLIVQIKVS